MTQRSVIAKREKSLAEQLIIIMLLGVMMASVWYYFARQQQSITKAGFNVVANQFFNQVSAVRAQWYMDKNPNEVWLKEGDKTDHKRKVSVNKFGFVDSLAGSNRCVDIWRMVMNTPMVFMNEPISAIAVNENGVKQVSYCRFVIGSGEYFQYNPLSGEVTLN